MTAEWQAGPPAEPPPPFRLSSPQVLELREGGKAIALFGLPFLLAGCLISFNALLVLFRGAAQRVGGSMLVFATLGVAFTCIGALMMFGRRWTTFDVSRGMLVRSYGLFVPQRTAERPLNDFNAVVLAYDAGDSDSPETYPVRLRAIHGRDYPVRTPQKFGESRAVADYLSAFLRLPLIDMISDRLTVSAPERTQETLRERLATDSEMTQLAPPAKLRSRIIESEGKTTIVIPSGGGLPLHILGIVFPLGVLLVGLPVAFRLLDRATSAPLAHIGLLSLVTLLIIPLVFVSVSMIVAGNRKRTTVVASPAGMELEQSTAWRSHTKSITAADLLDVDSSTVEAAMQNIVASSPRVAAGPAPDFVPWARALNKFVPSRGIVIKSRTELIAFGQGLPGDELRYLAWMLRKAVAGR